MVRRPHFIFFGPAIPIVAMRDYSRMPLTHKQWADAWTVCGPPSVERNMANPRLQHWQVIAAAYLEGLQHGSALAQEQES